MLPVTQAIDGAALTVALALAAVVGVAAAVVAVAVAAGVVGEGDAPEEHAVTTSAAATASTLNRRIPFSNLVSPLPQLGNSVPTASPRFRAGWSKPALNSALADC
jgi:hypothetical protein